MKKKETARIKKTGNFIGFFPSDIKLGWETWNDNDKANTVRKLAKDALEKGKTTYADIMDYIFFNIKAASPSLTNDKNYFFAANLWIWQKSLGVLGGVIGEEIENFKNSVTGQAFKKQQDLDNIQVQTANEDAARQKAVKDKQLQQELAAPSTAKTALIAGGVIFVIILGIFLYKKYA